MVENRSSIFGIIAIILGASGLGVGAYSVINFQLVEGLPGDDGQDLVGIQVGILDPDHYEIVSGLVEVRILLWNSSRCSINVFVNGSLNATSVPWAWDTTKASDGWWNISVRATDNESNVAQDEVMVYVLNNPAPTPRAKVAFLSASILSGGTHLIDFDAKNYDSTDSFNLTTDSYSVPENGYYLVIATVQLIIDPNMVVYRGVLFIQIQMGAIISLTEFTGDTYDVADPQLTLITTDVAYFSEGDQVQVYLGVSPGGILLMGGRWNTFFTITKLTE